jgi:hypothetical protein
MVGSEYCIGAVLDGRRLEVLVDLFRAWWGRRLGGADIPALAIEMALGSGQGFWEMAANGLSGQSRPHDKAVFVYGMNEG